MASNAQQIIVNAAKDAKDIFTDRKTKKKLTKHMEDLQDQLRAFQGAEHKGIRNPFRGILFDQALALDSGAKVDEHTVNFIRKAATQPSTAFQGQPTYSQEAHELCKKFLGFTTAADLPDDEAIKIKYREAVLEAAKQAKENTARKNITDFDKLMFLEQAWRLQTQKELDTEATESGNQAEQIKISPILQRSPGPHTVSASNGLEGAGSITMHLEPTQEGFRGWFEGNATITHKRGPNGQRSFEVTRGREGIPALFRGAIAGVASGVLSLGLGKFKTQADDVKAWGKGWDRNTGNAVIFAAAQARETPQWKTGQVELTYRTHPGMKVALDNLLLANQLMIPLTFRTKPIKGSPQVPGISQQIMDGFHASKKGKLALDHKKLIEAAYGKVLGKQPNDHTGGVDADGMAIPTNRFTFAQHQAAMHAAVMADIFEDKHKPIGQKYKNHGDLAAHVAKEYEATKEKFVAEAKKSPAVQELLPDDVKPDNLSAHLNIITQNAAVLALARQQSGHDIATAKAVKAGTEAPADINITNQLTELNAALGPNIDFNQVAVQDATEALAQAHVADLANAPTDLPEGADAPTPIYDALQSIVPGTDGNAAAQLATATASITDANQTYNAVVADSAAADDDTPVQTQDKQKAVKTAEQEKFKAINSACKLEVKGVDANKKMAEHIIQGPGAKVTQEPVIATPAP